MNGKQKGKPASLSSRHIVNIVLGILAFGLLMAIRAEMHSHWLRIACAGLAGAALGFSLVSIRRWRP